MGCIRDDVGHRDASHLKINVLQCPLHWCRTCSARTVHPPTSISTSIARNENDYTYHCCVDKYYIIWGKIIHEKQFCRVKLVIHTWWKSRELVSFLFSRVRFSPIVRQNRRRGFRPVVDIFRTDKWSCSQVYKCSTSSDQHLVIRLVVPNVFVI